MRVRLEAPDRPAFWLAGNPGLSPDVQSQAMKFRPAMQRSLEAKPGTEWDTKVFIDRKNQGISYSIEVIWQFDDFMAKMRHLAKLLHVNPAEQMHRWAGDVWMRIDARDGSSFEEHCIPGAVISLEAIDQTTETKMVLTYRIQGPGFSASGSGAINLRRLFGYTSIGPAILTPTGDQMDAQIATLGIAYGTGAIEIIRTDADGLVQAKSWPLAGYTSSGFGFPIGSHFAAMVTQWNAEFGSGLSSSTLPWILTITSDNIGADAYVAINFYVNDVLTPWVEVSGGFAGLIRPILNEHGEAIIGDLG